MPRNEVGIDTTMALIKDQLERAMDKHAPMRGPHEGYAVILEEVDELWAEVKAQTPQLGKLRTEALHVAAMAARFVMDLTLFADTQDEPTNEG